MVDRETIAAHKLLTPARMEDEREQRDTDDDHSSFVLTLFELLRVVLDPRAPSDDSIRTR